MAFLRTVGCECSECGPDPCTAGCECDLFQSIEFDGDDTLDVTGQFVFAQNLSVTQDSWTCEDGGVFVTGSSQIQVYANGSLLYDSGCVSGAISTTVSIPAGTTILRLVHVHDCLNQCDSGGVGDQTAYFECV
jgi:hypothetical protein